MNEGKFAALVWQADNALLEMPGHFWLTDSDTIVIPAILHAWEEKQQKQRRNFYCIQQCLPL